jgi:phage N-6-adenine-methyltransferase
MRTYKSPVLKTRCTQMAMSKGKRKARDHLKVLKETSYLGVPDDLFDKLNSEFSFTVDASSSHSNAKCVKHWTREENGLSQCWQGEVVWCNPLFDRDIKLWVKKGVESSNCTVVYLLPVSTDTAWFAMVWDHQQHRPLPGCEVRFLPRRLKYKPAKRCAAFASCIVVVRRN